MDASTPADASLLGGEAPAVPQRTPSSSSRETAGENLIRRNQTTNTKMHIIDNFSLTDCILGGAVIGLFIALSLKAAAIFLKDARDTFPKITTWIVLLGCLIGIGYVTCTSLIDIYHTNFPSKQAAAPAQH